MKRRAFVTGVAGAAAALSSAPRWTTELLVAEETLRSATAAKGILYGANTRDIELLMSHPDLADLMQEQCGVVETGRNFQWRETRPSPTAFDFRDADAFVSWAALRGLKISECHLVWHRGEPYWLPSYVNAQNWRDLLTTHIKTMVSRYAGKIYSWVVVNEALRIKDRRPDGLRESFWLNAAGPEYIDVAFRTAAAADPGAVLVYNDDDFERDLPTNIAKRRVAIELFKGMKQRGVPIHAVGIEAHLPATPEGFSAPGLIRFVDDVAALGMKTIISELEFSDAPLQGDPETRDEILAKNYGDFLNAVLANRNVTTILMWSLANKYHWRNDFKPTPPTNRPDGTPLRGMPFGYGLERTAVYDAILKAFEAAPSR